jgi:GNAT superfamily N-acetyltransferase
MEELSAPEPLSNKHILQDFDSGSVPIDRWLKTKARAAVAQRTAKVFVVCKGAVVVGYFALASSRLRIEELPEALASGLPKHPIPTVLLARLGVHKQYQGSGLGKALVADAVARALASNENVASFALITNAKLESRSFYLKLGFKESPADPTLLVLSLVFE